MPEQNTTQPEQSSAEANWRDAFAKHWAQLRMAGEAFMLDKVARGQQARERTERFAATGKLGDMVGSPEDDMGFKIGDTHVYQQAPQSGMSGTAKLALSALLGGAVASAPVWGPVVLGMLGSDDQPAAVQPTEPATPVNPSLEGGGLSIEIVRPND